MIPTILNTFNNLQHYMGPQYSDMIPSAQDDSSLRVMGMLMTISLGIFAILFLYVLYNMTAKMAGATIIMLFFIALAFFIVLIKTFKLLNRLVLNSRSNVDFESQSGIHTISEIVVPNRILQETLPPSYEEAIKNYIQKLPTTNTSLPDMSNKKYPIIVQECARCSSSAQIS